MLRPNNRHPFKAVTLAVCSAAAVVSLFPLPEKAVSTDDWRPAQRLENFEEIFNSDDERLVEQFIRNNFADADPAKVRRLLGVFQDLHREFGPVSVAEIHDMKDGTTFVAGHVVLRTGKEGAWKNFQFFTSAEHGGRFTSFAIVDAIEPRNVPAGDFSDPELQQWLSDHIDWLETTRRLSGAFVVSKNGKPVFKRFCGWQDRARQIANTESTVFNLASGGKMFTAISVAQLVESGVLNFDDTIADHLADYPNPDIATAISIRQLLTHTSGLPEYWTDEYEQQWHRIRQLHQILPYITDRPLSFQPGSKHEYCNSNYILLGLIVEAASSTNYYDLVSAKVFEPAGMKQAGFFETTSLSDPLARAYEFVLPAERGQQEQWHVARLGVRGSSAGGGYASLDDMLSFDRALNEFQLLNRSLTAELTTGKVKQPVGGKYGFGFIEANYRGKRWFGHGGTGPGSFFEYKHFPDSGYTIIFFANHDGTAAHDVFRKLQQIVVRSANRQ